MMRASSAANHKLRRRFASYADRSDRSTSGGRPRPSLTRPSSIRLRAASGRTPWYSARRRTSLQSSAERFQFAMRSRRSASQLRAGQRAQELESVFRLQRSARHGRRREEFAHGNQRLQARRCLAAAGMPGYELTRTTAMQAATAGIKTSRIGTRIATIIQSLRRASEAFGS